ncbi:MAG: NADH-quinone oxidoreductase subunit M [Trueperaceae bacterium]
MISLYVVLLPVLIALLVLLGRSSAALVRGLAFLGGVGTFALSLFLAGSEGFQGAWLPRMGVNFSLDATGAGPVLVLVAALVMIPTLLVAATRVEQNAAGFVALLLLAQAGLNGIFLSKDLIVFYVFWEATLIPGLLLLGMFGGDKRRQAALKYLVYAVAGSMLMLVSILSLKALSGAASFHITELMIATPSLSAGVQTWLFVGMAIGMVVKLPLWPLHSWLIDLNEQNHPSGAADVLGSLYKVGAFGFFAWALPLLPAGAERVAPYLLALAAVTAVYGALAAISQQHLKRFLAYGSLSHMGIIGVGLFGLHLAGLSGAIYFLAAQMLSTGGLFLVAGMLYHRRRSFMLKDYGGLAKSAPAFAGVSLFLIFAYIGVPGLSNFPGEFMALLGAFQTSPWPAAFATLAVIAAGVYGVNLYQRLFQGPTTVPTSDLSALELYVLVPFIAGVLWLGISPAPQLRQIEQQAALVTIQLERAVDAADEVPTVTLAGLTGGEK